ncbi:MAG TPA: PAS domain S-box protein, partial [Allocoleopsis sp.]
IQTYEFPLEVQQEMHWQEIRIIPLGTDEVLIVVRDLTERKQTEEALRQSEERFRRAFDDAAIGMALVTPEGQLLKVNRSLCEIIGYSEAELLTCTLHTLTHPEDLELDQDYVQQMLSGERRMYQVQKRYLHRQGHIVWVLLSVSLIKQQNDRPLYFVTQIQDISDRYAVDRIKDEFISIVSHELRTPLTAIRGSLGILESGVFQGKPDNIQRMLQIALNNSERLVRLVNDILDLERLESGKVQMVMQSCAVDELMQQAVEAVQPIATQSEVRIVYTSIMASVWAAPDAIIQTLTNLLSNAIKFSSAGSLVWLTATVMQEDRILFSIQDQGRGIPPDKLETIFGRFQQVDVSDSRQKGGTGLGLAICKSIVQQHQGHIWAESTLGHGSTFYFTLPVAN